MKKLLLYLAAFANIAALALSHILFEKLSWKSIYLWEYMWRDKLYLGAAIAAPITSLILIYLAVFENGIEYLKTHMELSISESKRRIAENRKFIEDNSFLNKK
jgi:hypothetical protein